MHTGIFWTEILFTNPSLRPISINVLSYYKQAKCIFDYGQKFRPDIPMYKMTCLFCMWESFFFLNSNDKVGRDVLF
jgi:hypothetical protein